MFLASEKGRRVVDKERKGRRRMESKLNHGIYIVSKRKYIRAWHQFREKWPIISTWIDDEDPDKIDFSEAWPRYLAEAARAEFILVYLQRGEKLEGGILEIGAGLAGGAHVIVVGHLEQIEALVSARQHPKVHEFRFIGEALGWIQKQCLVPPYPNLDQNINLPIEELDQ
jgi:hypothetical protein